MPTEQRYKQVTSALKVLLFLFFSLFFSFSHAVSLGKLTVLSTLGQPLRAEVELLVVSPDEAASLTVKLAPGEAYKKSGIDYTSLLQFLNVSIEKEDDRHFVRIYSTQPINEPYIGILLDLSTDTERKRREYVILLDPAEWTNLRSAPLSSVASMQRLSRQQRAGQQAARVSSVAAARPDSVIGKKETPASTEWVVSRGDTLSKIAGRLGNRNISLEQMLVLLYRNNPNAFLSNNMNRLREGAVLSIPDSGAADGVSQREARRIVRLHASNFRGYSRRLAGMVQKSPPRMTGKTGPVAEGKITASVKEPPTPVSKSPDRLELSKARPESAGGMTAEEKIAMNRAIEDANLRITALEKNVSELRNLLDIMSKGGNALTKPAETVAAPAPETRPQTQEPVPKADTAEKTEPQSPQMVTGTVEKIPSSGIEPSAKEEGVSADQTLAKAEKKADALKKKEDDEEAQTRKKQDFWHSLKNNTVWHVAIGVTTALIFLIVLVMRMRRKKPGGPVPETMSAVPPPPKEKREEEVNPNIISGRDFLENLTGRKITDDDADDETAYRPMMDDDGDDIELEEGEDIVSESGEDSEEVIVEQVEIEEAVTEPEEYSERATSEAIEEDEVVEEDEGIAGEQQETELPKELVSESGKNGNGNREDDDDLAALQLDDSDEPVVEESEEEIEPSEPPPLELDLSDINLEPDTENEEDELPDMERVAEVEEPGSSNAEMAAKLELARAYMDMKDREGARELFEEVIELGTPKQVAEAQQAMQNL